MIDTKKKTEYFDKTTILNADEFNALKSAIRDAQSKIDYDLCEDCSFFIFNYSNKKITKNDFLFAYNSEFYSQR